jgi:hypothetical protein
MKGAKESAPLKLVNGNIAVDKTVHLTHLDVEYGQRLHDFPMIRKDVKDMLWPYRSYTFLNNVDCDDDDIVVVIRVGAVLQRILMWRRWRFKVVLRLL